MKLEFALFEQPVLNLQDKSIFQMDYSLKIKECHQWLAIDSFKSTNREFRRRLPFALLPPLKELIPSVRRLKKTITIDANFFDSQISWLFFNLLKQIESSEELIIIIKDNEHNLLDSQIVKEWFHLIIRNNFSMGLSLSLESELFEQCQLKELLLAYPEIKELKVSIESEVLTKASREKIEHNLTVIENLKKEVSIDVVIEAIQGKQHSEFFKSKGLLLQQGESISQENKAHCGGFTFAE